MDIIPHQLTQNVKLLQKAALWHNNKFLILQRSSDSTSRPDHWDLPGGNSEWPVREDGRSALPGSLGTADSGLMRDLHKDDLVREVFEETGIELQREDVQKCVHIGTFFDGQAQVFSIILGWEVQLGKDFREDSVLISEEHKDFKWIKREEFEEYDFGFAGEKEGFIRKIVGE